MALVGEEWIEQAVTHLNEYRASHRVPPLTWNNECFEAAKRQANYCSQNEVLEYGNLEGPHGRYGQSIHDGNDLEDAIDIWYQEGEAYDYAHHGFHDETHNFTQIIWKATRKVGVALSDDGDVIVANYWPCGNKKGHFKRNVLPIALIRRHATVANVTEAWAFEDPTAWNFKCDAPLHALLCGLNLEQFEESILKVTEASTLDELLERVESEDDLIGLLDYGMTQVDISNVYELIDEEKKATSLEAVVEDMLLNIFDEKSQMTGIRTLRDATLADPGISTTIGVIGGIEAILEAMVNHEGHTGILECACSALHHSLHDLPVNQKHMRDAGGLEIVLEAMERHMDCWEVQDQACLALASFLEHNMEAQTQLGVQGGVELILIAMERHKLSAIVQESCCHALSVALDHHSLNVGHMSKADGVKRVVECMKQHMDKQDVQEQSCAALHKALHSRPENKERFRQAGGMEVVLQSMRQYMGNDHICENGSGALGLAILNHTENKNEMGSGGGIQLILDVMRQHVDDVAVVHQCCRTLNIAMRSHKKNQELLRKLSGVQEIFSAMENHKECPSIIDEGCGALGSGVFELPNIEQPKTMEKLVCTFFLRNRGKGEQDEFIASMTSADGIKVIVQAMKQYPARAAIQVWGCAALVVATKGHPMIKHRMVEGGAIEAIIFSMQIHMDSPDVQLFAYVALATACSHGDDACQSRMAAAGGIEAVLEGMSQHMNNAKLQEHGCCALYRALHNHPGNQRRLEIADGTRIIEAAMLQHLANWGVQRQGAAALKNAFGCTPPVRSFPRSASPTPMQSGTITPRSGYASPAVGNITPRSGYASPAVCPRSPEMPTPRMILETPRPQNTADDAGDQTSEVRVSCRIGVYNHSLFSEAAKVEVESILLKMNEQYNDESVQEEGCVSLRKALIADPENAELLWEAGGLELIIRIMQKHHLAAKVQKEGCWVLYIAMITYPVSKDEVYKAGGIEVVLQAMREHTENEVVQENGCATLAVATIHHMDNKNRMGEAGGLEAIIQAMQLHNENIGIQEQGCLALRSAMISHATNRACFGAAGGPELVVEVLRKYGWHQGIVAQGFWALYNAMQAHVGNKTRVGVAGGVEAVVQCMRQHQANAVIQESGCRALHCVLVQMVPKTTGSQFTKDAAQKWNSKAKARESSAGLLDMYTESEFAAMFDKGRDSSSAAAILSSPEADTQEEVSPDNGTARFQGAAELSAQESDSDSEASNFAAMVGKLAESSNAAAVITPPESDAGSESSILAAMLECS